MSSVLTTEQLEARREAERKAIREAERKAKEERIRLMAELERQIIAEQKEYYKRVEEKLNKQYFENNNKVLNNVEEEKYQLNQNLEMINQETKDIDNISIIFDDLNEWDKTIYDYYQNEFKKIKYIQTQKGRLFLDTLKRIHSQTRVKFRWSEIYKKELISLQEQSLINQSKNNNLIQDIENVLKHTLIDENKYYEIFQRVQEEIEFHKYNTDFTNNIVLALEQLDYLVIDDNEEVIKKLINKEKVSLSVRNKDYKVVLALNKNNTLLTRFIKTVTSESDINNITSSQRIIDNENLKTWCSLQEIFQEKLKLTATEVVQNIIEDDEHDVLYVVDKNLSDTKIIKYEITQKENE